ncbi:MAG TPA: ABC transporter substrate-binding protein [Saprospiraceae bacterium]|nr:ABC transporter substrate-binding protein [Saprospiraceae bacterium]
MNFNVVYFLFLLLSFVACEPNKSNRQYKIFRYNQSNVIQSLDPAFAKSINHVWAIDHIFNQLIDLGDSMRFEPELATAWEVSEDGLHYKFSLRQDVFFQRDSCFGSLMTRKLTAWDVKYSFERLINPETKAPGSWVFDSKVDSIGGFEVKDDSTFYIHLKQAFSPLLGLLTMQYCSVIPHEAVEFYGNSFYKHPVGTGAFRLRKWLGRQGLFLEKNEHYFKKELPKLDGIRISFIEDKNVAYLEFLKKKIDFFSGLQSSYSSQMLTKEGAMREDRKNEFQLISQNYLNTEYIGINVASLHENHCLRKLKVRQALNYAIDRKKLLTTLRNSVGTEAICGFAARGLPVCDTAIVKGYSYQPILAKRLLNEAGYFSGKLDQKIVVHTNKEYADVIQFVTRQWQELGVDVKIELQETSSLREQMKQGKLPLFRASWVADYPSEENFFTVFYSKNPAPPNYTRFSHPEYDRLYEELIRETDQKLGLQIAQKMENIIISESPVIFLFYDQSAWFSSKRILNIASNPINLLKLEKVDIK